MISVTRSASYVYALYILKYMKNLNILNITRLWLKWHIKLLLQLLVSFILGKISDS